MSLKCPCRIVGCVILFLITFAHICCSQAAEPQGDDDFSEGERIPLPDKSKQNTRRGYIIVLF